LLRLLDFSHRGTEAQRLGILDNKVSGIWRALPGPRSDLRDLLLLEPGNSFRFATEVTEVTEVTEGFYFRLFFSVFSVSFVAVFGEQITPRPPALGSAHAEVGGHKFIYWFRFRLKAGLRGKERPLFGAFFSLLPRSGRSVSYSYKGVT
jgi:hypothetical protein